MYTFYFIFQYENLDTKGFQSQDYNSYQDEEDKHEMQNLIFYNRLANQPEPVLSPSSYS